MPMVSKKSARRRVKTKSRAANIPVFGLVNAPNMSLNPMPSVSKRGASAKLRLPLASLGSAGLFSAQPRGLDSVGLRKLFPTLN